MMLTQNGLVKKRLNTVKFLKCLLTMLNDLRVEMGKYFLPKDFIRKFEIENRYENI